MDDSQPVPTNQCDPVNITLVLLGTPGSGKSETGNTVLEKKIFHTAHQSRSSTTNLQQANCQKDDIRLSIIDTPGLERITDFSKTIDYLKDNQIENYVFGIILRVGRYASWETDIIHSLFQDDKSYEYLKCRTFVIFTNTYELAEYGKQLSDDDFRRWLENAQDIRKLLTKHGLKYCMVENNEGKIEDEKKKEQSRCLIKVLKDTFAESARFKEKITEGHNTDYKCKLGEIINITAGELIKILYEKHGHSVDQIYQILNEKKSSMSREDIQKAVEPKSKESLCIIM